MVWVGEARSNQKRIVCLVESFELYIPKEEGARRSWSWGGNFVVSCSRKRACYNNTKYGQQGHYSSK